MTHIYGIAIVSHVLNKKTRNTIRETSNFMEDIYYSTEEDAQKRLEKLSSYKPHEAYVNSLNDGWLRQEWPDLNNPEWCHSFIAEIKRFILLDKGEDREKAVKELGEHDSRNSVYNSSEEDQL